MEIHWNPYGNCSVAIIGIHYNLYKSYRESIRIHLDIYKGNSVESIMNRNNCSIHICVYIYIDIHVCIYRNSLESIRTSVRSRLGIHYNVCEDHRESIGIHMEIHRKWNRIQMKIHRKSIRFHTEISKAITWNPYWIYKESNIIHVDCIRIHTESMDKLYGMHSNPYGIHWESI